MASIILIIMGVVLVLLGVFMIAFPGASLKKGVQPAPELLSQVRRSGILEVVFGVALAAVGFFTR